LGRFVRKVGRVEIVFSGNPDQGEQGIAPGIGQGSPHPLRGRVSLTGQTGQSEDSHSPEECASVVVCRSKASLARRHRDSNQAISIVKRP